MSEQAFSFYVVLPVAAVLSMLFQIWMWERFCSRMKAKQEKHFQEIEDTIRKIEKCS